MYVRNAVFLQWWVGLSSPIITRQLVGCTNLTLINYSCVNCPSEQWQCNAFKEYLRRWYLRCRRWHLRIVVTTGANYDTVNQLHRNWRWHWHDNTAKLELYSNYNENRWQSACFDCTYFSIYGLFGLVFRCTSIPLTNDLVVIHSSWCSDERHKNDRDADGFEVMLLLPRHCEIVHHMVVKLAHKLGWL